MFGPTFQRSNESAHFNNSTRTKDPPKMSPPHRPPGAHRTPSNEHLFDRRLFLLARNGRWSERENVILRAQKKTPHKKQHSIPVQREEVLKNASICQRLSPTFQRSATGTSPNVLRWKHSSWGEWSKRNIKVNKHLVTTMILQWSFSPPPPSRSKPSTNGRV